jgi:hypothetical protein
LLQTIPYGGHLNLIQTPRDFLSITRNKGYSGIFFKEQRHCPDLLDAYTKLFGYFHQMLFFHLLTFDECVDEWAGHFEFGHLTVDISAACSIVPEARAKHSGSAISNKGGNVNNRKAAGLNQMSAAVTFFMLT